MSTELATIKELPAPVGVYAGSSSLTAWAQSAQAAAGIARALVTSPFVPASLLVRAEDGRSIDYERSVGNVLGALLVGDEVGLAPMAALRSVDIVNGTPAMRAIALRAVVQAAGHELVLVESSESRAIVKGRRHGVGEWQESKWTMDRARKLGLVGKANWRNQPVAMLIARATAECARLVGADALLGLAYASEELADDVTGLEDAPQRPAEQPAKRTARRRTAQPAAVTRPPVADEPSAPDPEPDFDEPAAAGPEATDEPTPDPITKPQLAKLHAQFADMGITDRDEGLALIAGFIGRAVTTSKEVTKQEATVLIDELERRLLADQADGDES